MSGLPPCPARQLSREEHEAVGGQRVDALIGELSDPGEPLSTAPTGGPTIIAMSKTGTGKEI